MRFFTFFLASAIAFAQPAKPEFEVASVKKVTSFTAIGGAPRRAADRFTWTNAFLSMLVTYAYDLSFQEISGNIPNEIYTIEATLDPATTTADARLMLQSLLEERFQLKTHRETRSMPVYNLVLAPNGPRLKPATEDSTVPVGGRPIPRDRAGVYLEQDGRHLAGNRATLRQMSEALATVLRRPVFDRTGLTGTYDFDVLHGPEEATQQEFAPPPIRAVLQEALGLRIESATGPVSILVIDHIEEPSPN